MSAQFSSLCRMSSLSTYLTRFVHDNYIKLLIFQLITSRSMQSRQNNFATAEEIVHNFAFALPVLLAKIFQFAIYDPSLTSVARLSNRCLSEASTVSMSHFAIERPQGFVFHAM